MRYIVGIVNTWCRDVDSCWCNGTPGEQLYPWGAIIPPGEQLYPTGKQYTVVSQFLVPIDICALHTIM